MNQAKKRKYTVGRVAVSTIGAAVCAILFCSLFTVSMGVISSAPIWTLVIQLISLSIFIPIVYSPSWNCGDRDENAVTFGHMQRDRYKGLKIGWIAVIPFALTPIILVLSKLSLLPAANIAGVAFPFGLPVYRIINVHMLGAINALIPAQTVAENLSWLTILGVWLFHLIIPITTAVAYELGYRHISLMDKLVFKNKGKHPNRPNRYH